jgi:hypothetical protein
MGKAASLPRWRGPRHISHQTLQGAGDKRPQHAKRLQIPHKPGPPSATSNCLKCNLLLLCGLAARRPPFWCVKAACAPHTDQTGSCGLNTSIFSLLTPVCAASSHAASWIPAIRLQSSLGLCDPHTRTVRSLPVIRTYSSNRTFPQSRPTRSAVVLKALSKCTRAAPLLYDIVVYTGVPAPPVPPGKCTAH